MKVFSTQQIAAAEQALSHFVDSNSRWVILLAQMQSGKTDTFLLIACELIRRGAVDNIVIFSGNAETDLCEQLTKTVKNDNPEFWRKYSRYVNDVDEFENIQDKVKERIQIVWGTEKKKYAGPTEKTFFVWEEAHFAQDKGQGPDNFLHSIGIRPDGNQERLEAQCNYVLTVSATPFSEISDQKHFEQSKVIVKMYPGDGYYGVKAIKESGRLRGWTDINVSLNEALKLPNNGHKWAIVRTTRKTDLESVKDLILNNGWQYVEYDSSISLSERKNGTSEHAGYLAWTKMNIKNQAPESNTVILIKGMCRMGKNIKKSNLLFVFETSKMSESDTVLQGLLGRCCGYEANEVVVYLSAKILNSRDQDGRSDIDRYIELWDGEGVNIIPRKARNLTDKRVLMSDAIIPIAIRRDRSRFPTNDRKHLLEDVADALLVHPERLINKNSEQVLRQVTENYMTNWNGSSRDNIRNRYLDSKKKTRGIDKARKLLADFADGRPCFLGSGVCDKVYEIGIWVSKNIPGMDSETLYVTSAVKKVDHMDEYNIPVSTNKECFGTMDEDEAELMRNGGFTINLPLRTAIDVDLMKKHIVRFVELSNEFPESRRVTSQFDLANKEFKGIMVDRDVNKSLLPGGKIYKEVKSKFGCSLTLAASSESVPASRAKMGFVRYASISW